MLKGAKTQITLTPAQRYQSSHRENKQASAKTESHELTGIGGPKAKLAISAPETIVDDMVYRKTARMIAKVDISYSCLMMALQLLGLILGASHTSNNRAVEATASPYHRFSARPTQEPPGLSPKVRETIAVLVWTGLFTVCIVQLLVAGALYGGTNERDGRKCIRNCRMWVKTTTFLIVLLFFQIMGVFVIHHPRKHVWILIVLIGELSFRIVALIYIKKFIKELVLEYCDDDNNDRSETVHYEPLLPSPLPIPKNTNPNANYEYNYEHATV